MKNSFFVYDKNQLLFETKRLMVRCFAETDMMDAHEYLSNSEVMKYIEPVFSLSQTKEFIELSGIKHKLIYAIIYKQNKKCVGHLIYHPFDDEFSYEVGWIMNNEHWRQGLCTEMTKELINYSVIHGLHTLVIETDQDNEKVKRIAEKFGFILEKNQDKLIQYRLRLKKF